MSSLRKKRIPFSFASTTHLRFYKTSFVLLIVSGGLTLSALGQDLKYTPSLAVTGRYSDNILFSEEDEVNDFNYEVTPGLKLNYFTELLYIGTSARLRFIRFHEETFLDREDHLFNLFTKYRLTERTLLTGRTSYYKDVALESRLTDVEQSGSGQLEDRQAGLETFLSDRRKYRASLMIKNRLTELMDARFRYQHMAINYDLRENSDKKSNDLSVNVTRRIQEKKDAIGIGISFEQDSSEVVETDSYTLSFIWNHQFREISSIHIEIGARYTESEIQNNWDGAADVLFTKIGETRSINIGYKQDLQIASNGHAVNVSRLYWEFSQNISPRLQFDIEGDFYVAQGESKKASEEDSRFLDIISSLRYKLTETNSLILSYNLTHDYELNNDGDVDKQRNRIWLTIEFNFPNQW